MHTFPGKGEYKVCMTVIRTTPDGTQCKVKYAKEIKISGVFIFNFKPNPASEYILLTITNQSNTSEEKDIQILDMKGQVAYAGKVLFNEFDWTKVNIDQLSNGVYFVKVFDKDQVVVKKLIKIR